MPWASKVSHNSIEPLNASLQLISFSTCWVLVEVEFEIGSDKLENFVRFEDESWQI